jgi:alginate O-acetyltransferase complex protein AlgI
MLFNSVHFAIFLPIVFALYWVIAKKKRSVQNALLLVSSYFFYACWDWRFLFLLIFSTLLDYYTGLKMEAHQQPTSKKSWLWLSIIINLFFLGVFKYYNFFASSFVDFLAPFGVQINLYTLQIILPVGISFYTFHGLSYVIDIYFNKIKPEKNFVNYALFVSFFPLLVAGPIERATHLLPQIKQARTFNYAKAVDGLRQILWGLFKKIVIADQCAEYVNTIFANPSSYQASTLVLAAMFFAIQIYGDFSGYTDIALGTARLFGIDLLQNFAYPYFSRDIAEFWRRWHISLSSWFRDYLYIPLGGSKVGKWLKVRNTFIIFLVSGLWHGANWTFITWGLLHALFMMPAVILNTQRKHLDIVAKNKWFPGIKELVMMVVTFMLTTFAWIVFRSDNLTTAYQYIKGLFSSTILEYPMMPAKILLPLIVFFIFIEWVGRSKHFALADFATNWLKPMRWAFYLFLVLLIFLFQGQPQTFIYFQF